MKINIREADVQDAEAISILNTIALGYYYPIEDTERKLVSVLNSSKEKVFVAVAENVVVGYIHANDYDVLYYPALKNIMGIAVAEEYRRCGIGKELLGAVEAWAKETGAKGIRFVSGAGRKEAHAFYRNCGFGSEKDQINFKKMF